MNLKFKDSTLKCTKIFGKKTFYRFGKKTIVTYKCGGRWTLTEKENAIVKTYFASRSIAKVCCEALLSYAPLLIFVLCVVPPILVVCLTANSDDAKPVSTFAPLTYADDKKFNEFLQRGRQEDEEQRQKDAWVAASQKEMKDAEQNQWLTGVRPSWNQPVTMEPNQWWINRN